MEDLSGHNPYESHLIRQLRNNLAEVRLSRTKRFLEKHSKMKAVTLPFIDFRSRYLEIQSMVLDDEGETLEKEGAQAILDSDLSTVAQDALTNLEALETSGFSPNDVLIGVAARWLSVSFWHGDCDNEGVIEFEISVDGSSFRVEDQSNIQTLTECDCDGWEDYCAAGNWKNDPVLALDTILSCLPEPFWCLDDEDMCECDGKECTGTAIYGLLQTIKEGGEVSFMDYCGLIDVINMSGMIITA